MYAMIETRGKFWLTGPAILILIITTIPVHANPAADFPIPSWTKDAIIYHIFVDRFRNGDPSNDPIDGTEVYEPRGCAGYPHPRPGGELSGCLHDMRSWTDPLLTPSWGLDFHGGDLKGIIDQINAGYFTDLGVNTLLLSPIFASSSNDGFDTNDYFSINPYFGDSATFNDLITATQNNGLRLILTAVFNNTGMDSKYIDPYADWANPPTYEFGACESATSPYRPWITPGSFGTSVCDGGWGWTGRYDYDSRFPEFVDNNAGVRDLLFRGGAVGTPSGKSVTQFWQETGIHGWFFFDAQDITHDFFTEMRPYIKGSNLSGSIYGDSQVLMLGVNIWCEWGFYQSYINSAELDVPFNYCFRDWAYNFGSSEEIVGKRFGF